MLYVIWATRQSLTRRTRDNMASSHTHSKQKIPVSTENTNQIIRVYLADNCPLLLHRVRSCGSNRTYCNMFFRGTLLKTPAGSQVQNQMTQTFPTFCLQHYFTFYDISARLHMEHTRVYCKLWARAGSTFMFHIRFHLDLSQSTILHAAELQSWCRSSSNGILKKSSLHCGWSHELLLQST